MAKRTGPKGAVERVFGQLLVGTAKSMRAHDERNREMGFAEVMQQYPVFVDGTAAATVTFTTCDVTFDYPMHYAPGQRDSELDRPHFWFGAEIDQDVIVSVSVADWTTDSDNGAYIGATVRIGVIAASTLPFTARIHLTFQGWGALAEDDLV